VVELTLRDVLGAADEVFLRYAVGTTQNFRVGGSEEKRTEDAAQSFA
jgi:hypothetical protein